MKTLSVLLQPHHSMFQGCRSITSINYIVTHALQTGFLSTSAEEKLRQLLQTTNYGIEELRAYSDLQKAVMDGWVRQESRERLLQQVMAQVA
ncbi:hypothetical protein [Spirulina subsalsa]|nr:hypothetical protein [Spirulina subsalsa]